MSQLTSTATVLGQGLFTDSATQYQVLGDRAFTPDGRGYVYALAGGTSLVAGKLQQSAAEDVTNWENLAVSAAAIGANTVTTTTTLTISANDWSGGYLLVTVTPGVGLIYRIKSNPAATAAAVTITLEDTIQVALTTSSKIDVIPSPYWKVIVNPATATGLPVGVCNNVITNAQYGWLQVKGVANVLADGAITVGTAVVASNGTAGAVETLAGSQAPVGIAVTGIATTEYGAIFLTL